MKYRKKSNVYQHKKRDYILFVPSSGVEIFNKRFFFRKICTIQIPANSLWYRMLCNMGWDEFSEFGSGIARPGFKDPIILDRRKTRFTMHAPQQP